MKYISIIIFGLFFTLVSCERSTEPEGPALEDLFGEFTILENLEASQPTVDYGSGESVFFTASFSKITNWELTIKGSNGAEKLITGSSKELDATNATWDGSTSIFPSFSPGSCSVDLLILEDSTIQSTSVTMSSSRTQSGIIVADFESGIDPNWNIFAQTGANMSFTIENTGLVPQGNFYYDMGGEVGWDWLIGLMDFPATAYGANGFDLGTNANDIYFNVVINNPPGISNAITLFQFREDENGDGSFTEASEDMYAVELKGLDEGWQIISMKYSDLQSLVNGAPSDPNGNGVHDPDKLHMLSCLFLADPNSGYSQTLMDYVVFTIGEPLRL